MVFLKRYRLLTIFCWGSPKLLNSIGINTLALNGIVMKFHKFTFKQLRPSPNFLSNVSATIFLTYNFLLFNILEIYVYIRNVNFFNWASIKKYVRLQNTNTLDVKVTEYQIAEEMAHITLFSNLKKSF